MNDERSVRDQTEEEGRRLVLLVRHVHCGYFSDGARDQLHSLNGMTLPFIACCRWDLACATDDLVLYITCKRFAPGDDSREWSWAQP